MGGEFVPGGISGNHLDLDPYEDNDVNGESPVDPDRDRLDRGYVLDRDPLANFEEEGVDGVDTAVDLRFDGLTEVGSATLFRMVGGDRAETITKETIARQARARGIEWDPDARSC